MTIPNTVQVPVEGVWLVQNGKVTEVGLKHGYAGVNVHLVWDLADGEVEALTVEPEEIPEGKD